MEDAGSEALNTAWAATLAEYTSTYEERVSRGEVLLRGVEAEQLEKRVGLLESDVGLLEGNVSLLKSDVSQSRDKSSGRVSAR